jgi:CRISPR-associated protein Csm3
MNNTHYKLLGKYIIKADLECITGLHIGGRETEFEIGGIENPVIRDPLTDIPYIPGSSLKGKMRYLLEWANGKITWKRDEKNNIIGATCCECGECEICIIFGPSSAKKKQQPSRLTIRDSFPKKETIEKWENTMGKRIYTEIKPENSIDRLTSAANPRTMERVPAGSEFEVEMIFDIYEENDKERLKTVFEGMKLLEDSSLGGSGSRGSGKVIFKNISIIKRDLNYYKGEGEESEVLKNLENIAGTVAQILKNFDKIKNSL